MPKTVIERATYTISDLSVMADSGWRDVSDSRVAELVECFLTQGLFGVGILRRPQAVFANGQAKLASDGNVMLLDGKHTIVALQKVAAMYEAGLAVAEDTEPDNDSPTYTALLVKAITEGVEVDLVEFSDDDGDLRVAYCAAAHDEATNKYKVTSIKDLVDVATRYHRKAPGGSWEFVRENLLKVYGPNRRTFVHRMLVAAQTLNPAVLELLERYGVPNSYIYDNSYFSGHGRDAGKRLGDVWRAAVINLYGEEVSKGMAFSKASFDAELCSPLKHAERWVKDKRREFGALTDSPAFRRVEEFLMTSQARPLVLRCMRLGIRLEGSGPNSSGDAAGIDQCRIVCDTLQEAAGRKTPAPASVAEPSGGGTGDSQGSVPEEGSSGSAMLTGMETEDTARAAALSKTESAKSRLLQYQSFSELSGYLTRILVPSEKVTFFIDFITSKARVPMSALDDVGRFLVAHGHGPATAQGPSGGKSAIPPLKVRIFVPTGPRLDLVSAIQGKLATVAPGLSVFF